MEQQFRRLKTEHNSAILIFRLGDFYEAFYEDAITVALECDYGYNRMDNGAARVSIAKGQIQVVTNRLRNRGYDVAVIEEREP